MAVSNPSGLTINNQQTGIQYTKVTDSSSDWSSVANSTYFYDIATAVTYYKDSTGTVLSLFSAAGLGSGIVGISNTSGVPTFYSTLSLAITAATSGDTITLYGNITETGATAINLKDGVNINFNGFTYTLNNTGTTNAFQDNGVAVTCSLYGGTIKRIGATTGSSTNTACLSLTAASKINGSLNLSSTNSIALYVNNASAKVQNINVYTSAYGCCNIALGTLSDSYINCPSTSIVTALTIGGFVMNTNVECGDSAYGITILSTGYAENCSVNTVYGIGINCSGKALNCTAFSSGGIAIRGNYNTGIIQNCVAYSTANNGIYTDTCIIINSTGYSTAAAGISCYASTIYNSFGYSSVSNGIYIQNGYDGACYVYNCTAISTAAVGMVCSFQGGDIKNCVATSRWNNAGGHAMQVSAGINAGGGSVTGCNLQVANSSANCLYGASALTLKYANMVFANSTTAVNANITQGITNTSDSKGNILI
jgi:hypothetical protein